MENEEIYRDVIYVYEEPDFSENRAIEIKENLRNLIDRKKDLAEYQESSHDLRHAYDDFYESSDFDPLALKVLGGVTNKLGNFFAKVQDKLEELSPDNMVQSYTSNINKYQESINLAIEKIEKSQTQWFPPKYKDLFNSSVNHNFNSEEEFQTYFNSLLPICENLIQKMKNEIDMAHILSIKEMNNLKDENRIRFINVRNFTSGQILIKHPFMPKTYMGIETSENALFHIKMQCLSRIMQCLGATRISGHAYVSENKKREIDTNGKISYSAVSVYGSFNKNQDEKYESDYILEDAFSGDFSEFSYEEALKEAKRIGLYDDFDIRNLLDQRNPQKENKMTARKVKIELTRELNESLDIAFGLQASGFGVNGAYKEILETNRKVMFELEIEF